MAEFNADLYDRKLLYELDKNSKINVGALSKKLRRSKSFVIFRMKKLEEVGIVTGYYAIVDMSKLGYFSFRVYFKFQGTSRDEGQKFVEFVKSTHSQVWTITSMHGKWDYALFLGVKNINEFHTIWDNIMLSYKSKIKNYNVAVYAPIFNFNRTFFLEKPVETIQRVYGSGEEIHIDQLDWRILETYAADVRLSSLAMAKKLYVSADTIRNRIRNLEKNRIIEGYKIGLNLEKLGFVSYRIDLQLKSTNRNKELFAFCKMHKNIYQINKTIGGADFEIEVIVKDLNHLLNVIEELKEKFKDVINDVEYFGFSTFHILKYIPD